MFKVVLTFEEEEEAEVCKLFRSLTLPLWECRAKQVHLNFSPYYKQLKLTCYIQLQRKRIHLSSKNSLVFIVLFVLSSQLVCIVYRCPEQFFLPSGVPTRRPIKKRNNILRKRRLVSPFFFLFQAFYLYLSCFISLPIYLFVGFLSKLSTS